MELSLTLKEARQYRGKTVTEMAKTLNVTRDTYRKWEEDSGQVKIRYAKQIADILNMSASDIFFGK